MKRALVICALILSSAVLALSGPYASADQVVYRWNDADGNPVNSDRPPPKGVDYQVISTSSNMVRPVDAEEGAVPLTVEPSASNDFQQVDTGKTKIEKNPEYCQRARDNLAALDLKVRIQMRDEQGELYYLSDEDRAAQRTKALDTIEVHCE